MSPKLALALSIILLTPAVARATTYEVGPGKTYTKIAQVPWASLMPGDMVLIDWQATPYFEKWCIDRQGTASAPITISGVAGPNGQLPVISGNGAVAPTNMSYLNEERGVIKVGGSVNPPDVVPAYIVIENLEVLSARAAYSFTDTSGTTRPYIDNAAGIHLEEGQHLTVRNCVLHDCGDGFFSSADDVLLEASYLYDNGLENDDHEHDNYTGGHGITFQFNRWGPLRANCFGNGLKDRSSGVVVRYNWFTDGNHALDLVDGTAAVAADPAYGTTWVYGNVFVKTDGAQSSQLIHYGGDTGATSNYRGGTLYFYGNTVVSTRTGVTTLFALDVTTANVDCRDNIIYLTSGGSNLGLFGSVGTISIDHCWLQQGWNQNLTFNPPFAGTLQDQGGHVIGTTPGFADEANQDYRLAPGSGCIGAGTALDAKALAMPVAYLGAGSSITSGSQATSNDLLFEYVKHQQGQARPSASPLDIGAFAAAGPSVLASNPSSVSFGSVAVGASATLTVTLSNTGSSSLALTAATQAPFTIVSGASLSIAAGQTGQVQVSFDPVTAGQQTGTLSISGGASLAVALSGNGTGGGSSGGGTPSPSPSPSSSSTSTSTNASGSGATTLTAGSGHGSGGGCEVGGTAENDPLAIAPLALTIAALFTRRTARRRRE